MKLELAQIPVQDGSIDENLGRILKAIEKSGPDTDLIMFPEAALTGFPVPYTVPQVAQSLTGVAMSKVREAARGKSIGVAIGLAENDGGRYFNTTVLIDRTGEINHFYRKTHLWPAEVDMFEAESVSRSASSTV
jgi:(R)-amidase